MATYGSIPTSTSPESGGGGSLEFISRAKNRLQSDLGTRRPWKEMADLTAFNIPSSFSEAISRIQINQAYFRTNYAIIILVILFLSLLWHPISLIVFILTMSLWLFFYFLRDEPLMIFNRTIDDQVILIVLSVVMIVALFLTHVTINILVSISVGVVLVLIHAALRKNEDLFVDDDDDVEDLGQLPLNQQPSISS
ncbi:Prenylated rab acceptor PRA1 [Macleaya cordata]|uniref:PRA1 family protein n=1 Tax=Macleaya cordata TaxID=56857 RepID=A0A200QDE0_MACCD|nr:Prenylated rab acceptor PRA1 [Macleaya cordata]